MTDDRMALKALLEKASDTELLSEMLAFVAGRLLPARFSLLPIRCSLLCSGRARTDH